MRIVKLTAENLKKLKAVEIVPDGSVVQITGANGSGKSSVLDSIFYALAGTKEIPSHPVRRGTQKAIVKLDLGEILVTRRFTEGGGTTLSVEGAKGATYKSPQKMLDDLLGSLSFDPLAFSRMDAKSQLNTLRGMVQLDVDIDAIDAENKRDYDARTNLNRDLKAHEAQAEAITVPEGTPDEPVDIGALLQEMSEAEAYNREHAKRVMELAGHRRRAEELKSRIVEIETALKALRLELSGEEKTVENFLLGRDEINTFELRAQVESAQTINANVAEKNRRASMEASILDLKADIAETTAAMEERTNLRQQAIANAAMPVPGLSFGEGEILFNGLPLDQASDAEQLRISVAIAMASNPELRVMRIKDGSLLDDDSLALVSSMAEEHDWQIWIEAVDKTGKVGIFMEDGMVKTVNKNDASLEEL
jgi:DNA repair exonuclease SbcCD ATPase subunit